MVLSLTETIYLKTLGLDDTDSFFHTISLNRNHLRKWTSWVDQIKNKDDAMQLIEESIIQTNAHKSLIMGIFRQGQILGCIEMQDWDHQLRKANLGYWLAEDAEGKGLMFAAGQVFLHYLFEQLKLNKVELVHLIDNKRSAALATRLGFRVEGILRDNIMVNGAFKDLVSRGLLMQEFSL